MILPGDVMGAMHAARTPGNQVCLVVRASCCRFVGLHFPALAALTFFFLDGFASRWNSPTDSVTHN